MNSALADVPRILFVVSDLEVLRRFYSSGLFGVLGEGFQISHVLMIDLSSEALEKLNIPAKQQRWLLSPDPARELVNRKIFSLGCLKSSARSEAFAKFLQLNLAKLVGDLIPGDESVDTACEELEREIGLNSALQAVVSIERPHLIVVLSAMSDVGTADALRVSHHCAVPTLLLVPGWDHLSAKGILRWCPTAVGVLGEQTRRHAEAIQLIAQERIHPIGAPDYDFLFSTAPLARAEIRASLGMPREGELFAFYGMRRSFDELGTLRMIDNIIAELMLRGTKVIYRPHPESEQDRTREFCAQSWRSIVLDPMLVDEGGRGAGGYIRDFSSRASHLRNIYAAIDGIISAPSTTLLEGMWFGRPALVLAYGDNEHPMGPDVIASFRHVRELRDIHGFTWCADSNRLSVSFCELRRLSSDPDVASDLEARFRDFIFLDSLGYPERLMRLISAVLEETASARQ
jgi:hypothetical protein